MWNSLNGFASQTTPAYPTTHTKIYSKIYLLQRISKTVS